MLMTMQPLLVIPPTQHIFPSPPTFHSNTPPKVQPSVVTDADIDSDSLLEDPIPMSPVVPSSPSTPNSTWLNDMFSLPSEPRYPQSPDLTRIPFRNEQYINEPSNLLPIPEESDTLAKHPVNLTAPGNPLYESMLPPESPNGAPTLTRAN
jgi:hypothetical protein